MHKFLRAAGFSMYRKKKDIEGLMDLLEKEATSTKCVQIDEETCVCEKRTEVAPGIGICMVGEMDANGEMEREFYFPYLENRQESTRVECQIQRHAERETYAGMLDDQRIGISMIFYVQNFLDYREKNTRKDRDFRISSVNLAGLSTSGKILLPIKKTQKQIRRAMVASKDRNNLLEAAKNGDEDAMETLTIEDIDLYSKVSRRAMKEDLYSIIDSCFMPYGVECDQYAVIGEITEVNRVRNAYTKEEICKLRLDCSDIPFNICINSKDLLGEPEIGRRFKGQIWMQGICGYDEILR